MKVLTKEEISEILGLRRITNGKLSSGNFNTDWSGTSSSIQFISPKGVSITVGKFFPGDFNIYNIRIDLYSKKQNAGKTYNDLEQVPEPFQSYIQKVLLEYKVFGMEWDKKEEDDKRKLAEIQIQKNAEDTKKLIEDF
jgi:hypothetical protein